ncbi:MAG TPA: thioredoxin family protein [Desulfuromonadales bacterium]|jgi:small redox-active disulfide protein 2
MKIEVLGTGCAKCTQLYDNVKKALAQAGREAEVVKVQDIPSIMKYGVMSTPALVIDGVVKVSGKAPSAEEIRGWL